MNIYLDQFFSKNCKICGRVFKTSNRRTTCCSDYCSQQYREIRKLRKKPTNLSVIIAEIETYNKEHGTKLSYGEYVSGKRW